MLLQNLAPQFELFNGSIGKFRGLLYLTDEIEIKLKPSDVNKLKIKNLLVLENLDLKSSSTASHLQQLPQGSVLLLINERAASSDTDLKSAMETGETIICTFKRPNFPPHLPDFIVVEFNEYKKRGGRLFPVSRR